MHPEIIELIRTALVNGILSDAEKKLILYKASKLGIDKIEVEIFIEAQQHLREQELAEKETKCPSCGNRLAGLAKVCVCGHVIDSGLTDESKSLQMALEDLENLIIRVRSFQISEGKEALDFLSANVDKEIRFVKTRYAESPEVNKLIGELESLSKKHLQNIYKKKKRTQVMYMALMVFILGAGALSAYFYFNPKTDAERFTDAVMKKYEEAYTSYKNSENYNADSIIIKKLFYEWRLNNNHYADITVLDSINNELDEIIDSRGKVSEFYFWNKARKLHYAKDTIKAQKYLDTGFVFNQNFSLLYFVSGFLSKNLDTALILFSKAIEMERKDYSFVFLPARSGAYLLKNELRRAKYDLKQYIECYPKERGTDITWMYEKIRLDILLDEKREACLYFKKLSEQDLRKWKNKFPDDLNWVKSNINCNE